MKVPPIFISAQDISSQLTKLAKIITHDYKGKEILILGVLHGAFILTADLTRFLWEKGLVNIEIDFIGISSYYGKESSRSPVITYKPKTDLKQKNILLVEDIVDTGWSLSFIQNYIYKKNPQSLKTFVLLSKPHKREINIQLDYIGFEIPNVWVEGYGMDTKEKGRACPYIGKRD